MIRWFKTLVRKLFGFGGGIARSTWKGTLAAVKDFVSNFEAAAILTTSAIGISALTSKYAMIWTMPSWINAPMVVPVLAVSIVLLLTYSMQLRMKRSYY
jgi:hypothetical protein